MKVANRFNATLLKSPLHGLVSKNVVLITIVGKSTGKVFSTPVNYVQSGNDLFVISSRDRKWWRNLREGCPVTLHLRGNVVVGQAAVLEKQADVVQGLKVLLAAAPIYGKYLHLTAGAHGDWDPISLNHVSCSKVLVKITLPFTSSVGKNENL
jgi:deazaflavin-dependent oxidoreductase (nitroreductase family)